MIGRIRIGTAPLLSGAVSLVLAALLAASLSAPARRWEPPPAPPFAAVAPPASAPLPPARIDTAETMSRPLFVPSRRPPPPAPVAGSASAAAPGTLANMTLIGTIVGPGARVALIRTSGASVVQRLAPGQSVNGWEVVEIGQDHVVIRAGAGEQKLVLPPPSQTNGISHPAARPPPPAPPR